ncbi:substrate-binding domain-containing protein [Pseudoruegeria sp. SK021]|uniref:substrate-binding domain-containing protein n=1 Tax=Pseudoruegeria sp. SK021 TaxID=1933035 RepID=UPI000A25BED5|nr:substrate-binding domain-containing protein [Pseudoruegeria sp. SK021]OSP56034.1 hypothetical protein BV911_05015 [Pseudoruegeria sp. SK021]
MTTTVGPKTSKKKPRPRVKIVDLAQALGLTKGTVSRALNGYPDISESTRLRVRKAAETMGYVPFSSAQSIRSGLSHALGMVLRMDSHDAYRLFVADFLHGISRAAGARGWTLTIATAVSQQDEDQTLRRLAGESKADGFILPRTLVQDHRVSTLRDAGVPFILYGRTDLDAPYSWLDVLSEDTTADAVARLAALGHTRIGFVNGEDGYMYARLRHQGYLAGLASAGLPEDAGLVRRNCVTAEQGAEATLSLLTQDVPPTAIVFAVDGAALGAYRAARDLRLEMGQDLSVIGYDGSSDGRLMTPPLSTYKVDLRLAGERLADLLIDQIGGAEPETLHEALHAEFQGAGSHGAPRLTPDELARMIRAQHQETKGEIDQ